jgi:hypothetical protein
MAAAAIQPGGWEGCAVPTDAQTTVLPPRSLCPPVWAKCMAPCVIAWSPCRTCTAHSCTQQTKHTQVAFSFQRTHTPKQANDNQLTSQQEPGMTTPVGVAERRSTDAWSMLLLLAHMQHVEVCCSGQLMTNKQSAAERMPTRTVWEQHGTNHAVADHTATWSFTAFSTTTQCSMRAPSAATLAGASSQQGGPRIQP